MGEGKLLAGRRPLTLAALLVALSLVVPARGQGVVYREHWGYMHLEQRRLQVLQQMLGRDDAMVEAVARDLAEPDGGIAFRPVAKALARLQGRELDDAFLLRTMVCVYVLPEIADPEAALATCRSINVSVFLPFSLPVDAPLTFELVVRNAAGAEVARHRIERDTTLADLRMARPNASVDTSELPDGAYHATISTWIGGEPPAAADPGLSVTCHVLRGYQARAERAFQAVGPRLLQLDRVRSARLNGLLQRVHRAYTGEPFVVESDAARDLQRLEQELRDVPLPAPASGEEVMMLTTATDERITGILRRQTAGPRPLVVFAGGAPLYDLTVRRPTAPGTRDPGWAAHELAGFNTAGGWNIAFVESPGVGRSYVAGLQAMLAHLTDMLPRTPSKPLLVAEREAAAVLAFRLAEVKPLLSGLVLVGAGAMPAAAIEALDDLPVRFVPLHGYPGNQGVQRLLDYVGTKQADGSWRGDVAWLTQRVLPWTCALPLMVPELEQFAAMVFAR